MTAESGTNAGRQAASRRVLGIRLGCDGFRRGFVTRIVTEESQ